MHDARAQQPIGNCHWHATAQCGLHKKDTLGLQAYNVAQPHGTIAAGSVVVRTVDEMYQHGGSSSSS